MPNSHPASSSHGQQGHPHQHHPHPHPHPPPCTSVPSDNPLLLGPSIPLPTAPGHSPLLFSPTAFDSLPDGSPALPPSPPTLSPPRSHPIQTHSSDSTPHPEHLTSNPEISLDSINNSAAPLDPASFPGASDPNPQVFAPAPGDLDTSRPQQVRCPPLELFHFITSTPELEVPSRSSCALPLALAALVSPSSSSSASSRLPQVMNGYPTYTQPPRLFAQPTNASNLSSGTTPASEDVDVDMNMDMNMDMTAGMGVIMNMGFGGIQSQQQHQQQQQQQQRRQPQQQRQPQSQQSQPQSQGRPQPPTDDADKIDRRRSLPVYANTSMHMDNADARRLSMLDFAADATNAVNLDAFQFNPQTGMMQAPPSFSQPGSGMPNGRFADLSINTQFAPQNQSLTNLQTPASAFSSPQYPNGSMAMGLDSSFTNDFSMPMDLQMGNDVFFSTFNAPMIGSPLDQEFVVPGSAPVSENTGQQALVSYRNPSLPNTVDVSSELPSRTNSGQQSQGGDDQGRTPTNLQNHGRQVSGPNSKEDRPIAPANDVAVESFPQMNFPWPTPPGGFPSMLNNNLHMNTPEFQNVYSKTGFDMLGTLMRVAARPNPQIDIGSVDLSCAFVVCDAQAEDCPIVYCSENFKSLTGYDLSDIIGQNCRFLQSPLGKQEQGAKRKYCDDRSVRALREAVDNLREAQVSLINYRKGGQPFMNLLTMIPIAWEPGGPIKYFVGFQVDLVEQPSSVLNLNTDGTYRVCYQRQPEMPSYMLHPEPHKAPGAQKDVIAKENVAAIVASYAATGDSEVTRRVWDKVLLENTDDLILVLSLKALFLYLSPSCSTVLEYEPGELAGTGLSKVCHPSDIVPVTRELKEATTDSCVNVVFRIQRKRSGFMWFEGYGSLHTEQGKGRKCIILVGRSRPVYTLSKSIVQGAGGIGDNELWTKMSTSGMFLFVSGNVRSLLDRQPEELVGTSIQALMRAESKQNFGRMLENARAGRTVGVKHEMFNRRGQVLQAQTTLYPGDAVEGQKPTFLVAQTRLLKYSRAAHGQRPSMYKSKEHNSGDSRGSVPSASAQSEASSVHPASSAFLGTGGNTPLTDGSVSMGAVFPGPNRFPLGQQDLSLDSEDNVFEELKTTKSSSWQFELRQMERQNRQLAEQVQRLLAAKKKRKRRKGAGLAQKDCANCHTKETPEWRRGPSGNRDLCNSCGLRYAKQIGRVSPRNSSHSVSDKGKKSVPPRHTQSPIVPHGANSTSRPNSTVHSPLVPGERRVPTQANADSHAAKIARMESEAPAGYGGGIPPKIEEGEEPE